MLASTCARNDGVIATATTTKLRSTIVDWHHACGRKRLVRANQVPTSSATPMATSNSRTTSGASGAEVPRNPSLKVLPPPCKSLLDDDLGGHLRVNRAEIGIRSRLGEGKRKFLVGVEHFGLERLGVVRAGHGVRDIVAIRPSHRGSHRNGQRGRTEAEIVDLHFGGFGFLLRRQSRVLPASA